MEVGYCAYFLAALTPLAASRLWLMLVEGAVLNANLWKAAAAAGAAAGVMEASPRHP